MDYKDSRISKLREYLFDVIDNLNNSNKYQINADFLGTVGDYSLDKIPTESTVQPFINGKKRCRDLYSFRSRKSYSSDIINNLKNIGFFEKFEKIINSSSRKGILPKIDGIESIACLNCGTATAIDGTQAIFDIQIQVVYVSEEA